MNLANLFICIVSISAFDVDDKIELDAMQWPGILISEIICTLVAWKFS